jgi:hypothetical protein
MADKLFNFGPILTGAVDPRPAPKEGVDPLVKYDPNANASERAERARKLRYQQTVTGAAFKSGGWKYNEVNPKAVQVKHSSGLFWVYIDPPEPKVEVKPEPEAPKPVEEPVSFIAPDEEAILAEITPQDTPQDTPQEAPEKVARRRYRKRGSEE